ncbi:MAG: 50S ribosomal protein L9 [Ferrimicrobium sp.]
MNVLLRKPVAGLGKRGEVVRVADGYARNYLLPRGLAIVSTDKLASQATAMRAAAEERARKEREAAEAIAAQLASVELVLYARVGKEGRLFGSVTTQEIADELTRTSGIAIDRHNIHLADPIKEAGSHSVPVRLHPDVEVAVMILVQASQE